MMLTLLVLAAPIAACANSSIVDLRSTDIAGLLATSRFDHLTIVDAGVEQRPLAWAAWDTGTGEDRVVHLALLSRGAATGAAPLWSQSWPESYQPTLTMLTAWRYAGHPVLALSLQQGAAAGSVILVALDAGERPVLLERHNAEIVEFRKMGRGEVVLSNAPGSKPERECLRWDDGGQRVGAGSCDLRRR